MGVMKETHWFIIGFGCLLFLAGCSVPLPESGSFSEPGLSTTPTSVSVSEPTQSSKLQESVNPPAPPAVANVPQEGLYLAQPGNPLDVSIPDGMILDPGERFTKIWRLNNVGKEPWTPEFSLVWFSGDTLSSRREQALDAIVTPGNSIEISIDMVAPVRPGKYQSNWKLRASDGTLFGLGPQGDAPFWVLIEVVENQPTLVESTKTPTPEVIVLVSAEIILGINDELDLDRGEIVNGEASDLILVQNAENGFQLNPINGSKISIFGSNEPDRDECRSSQFFTDSIGLIQSNEVAYVCYFTNQELPGYASLDLSTMNEDVLNIKFTTWAQP